MSQANDALQQRPIGETVRAADLVNVALEKAVQCMHCRKSAISEMPKFVNLFADEIDKAVSKVRILWTLLYVLLMVCRLI